MFDPTTEALVIVLAAVVVSIGGGVVQWMVLDLVRSCNRYGTDAMRDAHSQCGPWSRSSLLGCCTCSGVSS